jgi:hypothetical protein
MAVPSTPLAAGCAEQPPAALLPAGVQSFAPLFNQSLNGFAVVDGAHRYVWCSDSTCRLLGVDKASLLGCALAPHASAARPPARHRSSQRCAFRVKRRARRRRPPPAPRRRREHARLARGALLLARICAQLDNLDALPAASLAGALWRTWFSRMTAPRWRRCWRRQAARRWRSRAPPRAPLRACGTQRATARTRPWRSRRAAMARTCTARSWTRACPPSWRAFCQTSFSQRATICALRAAPSNQPPRC